MLGYFMAFGEVRIKTAMDILVFLKKLYKDVNVYQIGAYMFFI